MNAAEWAYFIYYRLEPEAAASAPWQRLFREVEAECGVSGRLYGPAPDGRTWMEVYEPVAAEQCAAFEAALAAAEEHARIREWLAPAEQRHREIFARRSTPP